MAKYTRPTQLEKQTVIRPFANKWSTSARVDLYLLEKQTRAYSYYPHRCCSMPYCGCVALWTLKHSFKIRTIILPNSEWPLSG